MSATITASDDTPVAKTDAINLAVAGADANTSTGYDTDNYPASPQVVYRIDLTASGEDTLSSELFSTNADGEHQWPSVIIPAAGSWTATLIDTADESTVATDSITAS